MKPKAPKLVLYAGILALSLLTDRPLRAQVADRTLSGVITNASGAAVPGAKISAKNLNTGGLTETQADSAGRFRLFRLAPGDYEVTASADGFRATTAKVTLNLGGDQTLNLSVTAASAQPQAPGANLPNPPSSSKTEPSLSDLGFSQEQVEGNAKEQALLDKRTRMLKIHQKLGLITTAPLIATVVTSIGAGGKKTSTSERTAHMVLGAVSSDLYFTTAYFAIRAPRVAGTEPRPHSFPQGHGLDSRSGHDPHPHPWGDSLQPKEQRRTRARHRCGPWPGSDCDDRSIRRCADVCVA